MNEANKFSETASNFTIMKYVAFIGLQQIAGMPLFYILLCAFFVDSMAGNFPNEPWSKNATVNMKSFDISGDKMRTMCSCTVDFLH